MPRCASDSFQEIDMSASEGRSARKRVLPRLVITQTCDEDQAGAIRVEVKDQNYFVRPLDIQADGKRSDGQPAWAPFRFNLFPQVLASDGSPWPEANLFILKALEETPNPDMRTFDAHALDLADFLRFLEAENIDWLQFPALKLLRPTYRYRGYLNLALAAKELSAKTINRRMGTVVNFYRWLIRTGGLTPDYPPWVERDVYITFKDTQGFSASKTVTSTDLAVSVPKQDDPFSDHIQDGGLLRPLPDNEQEWLIEALVAAGNPEMTLIHLMGLLTGARLQTICTMKLRHALIEVEDGQVGDVHLGIGPGTGIDSKGGKQMVLHIPVWFYRALNTYANSERARRRRIKAGADHDSQYLFLTKQGFPYYADQEDRKKFDPDSDRRYDLDGGAIGTFVRNVIRPYIEKTFRIKKFSFRFHDTRATFGMNLTDFLLVKVEKGEMKLSQVRELVKTRMGHKSAATTDLYLDYRKNLKYVRAVVEEHELHLKTLCGRAMDGIL